MGLARARAGALSQPVETISQAARFRCEAGCASAKGDFAKMNKATRLNEARRAYVLGTIRPETPSRDGELGARHYRLRAEELRLIADEVLLRETGRTLLSLADSYEQMAEMVENGFTRTVAAASESA